MKIKDIVFTDHAIQRMKERGIKGEWAFNAVKFFETTRPGKEKHTTEFIRNIEDRVLTVIAKRNDIKEWVILSAWIDPPFEWTKDHKKRQSYLKKISRIRQLDQKMATSGFWGKLLITVRKQLGI